MNRGKFTEFTDNFNELDSLYELIGDNMNASLKDFQSNAIAQFFWFTIQMRFGSISRDRGLRTRYNGHSFIQMKSPSS